MREHPKVAPHAVPKSNFHKLMAKFDTKEMGVKAQLDIDMLM